MKPPKVKPHNSHYARDNTKFGKLWNTVFTLFKWVKSGYKLIYYYPLPYYLLVPTGSLVGPCFLIMYINPLLAGIPIIQGFCNTVRADAKLDNSALSTSLALNSEKKKGKTHNGA